MTVHDRGRTVSVLLVAVAIVVITLLTHSFASATAQDPPLFDLVEELRIVSNESSPQTSLTPLTGLTVLSDGSIVTAHASESLIRVYNPNGTFVRAFGRAGQGPGEFSTLTRIGSVGDSIWANDIGNRQIHVFTKSGQLIRSVAFPERARIPARGTLAAGSTSLIHGLLAGRRMLVSRVYRRPSAGTGDIGEADSTIYEVQDSRGAVVTRLLKVGAFGLPPVQLTPPGYTTLFSQPLDGSVFAMIAPGGERVVLTRDAPVFGGEPGQLRLTDLIGNGASTQTTVSLPPWRVPRNFADSVARNYTISRRSRAVAAGMRVPSAAELEAQAALLRAKLYVPEFYPVGGSVLGRDGSLWIKYKYDGQSWVVIVGGRAQRRVRVPDNVGLHQVSRDRVWATQTDANGLPIILRYRVVQRG